MRKISWLSVNLLASKEELCVMELFIYLYIYLFIYIFIYLVKIVA